jgi:hypothetical protein
MPKKFIGVMVAAAFLVWMSPRVAGQTLTVTATAGTTTPNPAGVGTQTSTPLSATVSNPPTPTYPDTLTGPFWSWTIQNVQYSLDGVSWGPSPGGDSEVIVQQSQSSPAATLNATFTTGGYWDIPCKATVTYRAIPSGQTWSGFNIVDPKPTAVEVVSITVTSGATRTNVTVAKNWAAVKGAGNVLIQLTLKPNTDAAAGAVLWFGGDSVTGQPRQRTVSKATSADTYVKATAGTSSADLDVWIIWSNLTVGIAGNISADDNATGLVSGNWPDADGGGKALGAIDADGTPKLTNAFAQGNIEGRAQLTPPGIEKIIDKTKWKMKRTVTAIAWDNGGNYNGGAWAAGPSVNRTNSDDTSGATWTDLDPTSMGSTGQIYDLDSPGCSCKLRGTTINHTSELYANFIEYATVTLDAETQCSDNVQWAYQAQIDGDKPAGSRVDKNQLYTNAILMPDSPHYQKRP